MGYSIGEVHPRVEDPLQWQAKDLTWTGRNVNEVDAFYDESSGGQKSAMDWGSKIAVPLDGEVIYANEAHAPLDQELSSVLSEVHVIRVEYLFKKSRTVVRLEQDPWPAGHVAGLESLAVDHLSSSHIQDNPRPDEDVQGDAIYGRPSFKIVCRRIHVSAQVSCQGHDG